MKKKILIIIGIILAILVIAGLTTSYADSARVRNGVEPRFTIKIVSEDGNKVTYLGLGYKVVRYPSVSPNEPYKNNRGVKYGSWFMKYELEEVTITLEDVERKISEYFGREDVDRTNLATYYIDEKQEVIVVGLIDDSKEKQDEFMHNVFSSCCGSKYRKYVESKSMIKFVESAPITTSNNKK